MNFKIKTLVAMSLCYLMTGAAMASDKKTNSGDAPDSDAKAEASVISKLSLARNLATVAAENKDAVLMVAAAKLEGSIATTSSTRDKTSETDSEGKADEKTSKAQTLFAQARELADGDEHMLAVIDSTESAVNSSVKGRSAGPASSVTRVKARSSDIYRLSFRGGEKAELAIAGDNDTDLDIYVYDENGNAICSSTTTSDNEYCSWYPRWTGIFVIKVKNLGSVYNQYRLVTN